LGVIDLLGPEEVIVAALVAGRDVVERDAGVGFGLAELNLEAA
jgi:hypothetical protein